MSDNRKEYLIELMKNTDGVALSDCELLELLILISNSRADYKKISCDLLQKYNTFNKVVNASVNELSAIDSMTENLVTALKLVSACGKRISQECVQEQKSSVLAHWNSFLDFCRQNMAYESVEEFRIFMFDENFRYLDNKVISKGTINQTYASPREVFRVAFNKETKHIILAHNHPSGDDTPSDEDKILTRDICEAFDGVGIDIFDHLIITSGSVFSFRENGLLDNILSD